MMTDRPADKPDAIEVVRRILEELALGPEEIPLNHVNALRGGQAFFGLVHEYLDGLLLLSRSDIDIRPGMARGGESSERRYRLDFAVRGNIKGMLPGRVIAVPATVTRGVVRKSVDDVVWQTPTESTPLAYPSFGLFDDQRPPGPGELYDGSPFDVVVRTLNGNPELKKKLIGLARRRGSSMMPRIVTDRWGDSMRLQASRWATSDELHLTYGSRDYVDVVTYVAKDLKQVRRVFGGVSF